MVILNLLENNSSNSSLSFPSNPVDKQQVRRGDYQDELFIYHAATNEWRGDRLHFLNYGVGSGTVTNVALRSTANLLGSANAGLELPYRLRFIGAQANWPTLRTGEFHVRKAGVTQFVVPIAGVNHIKYEFDDNVQYLVQRTTGREPIIVFWTGATNLGIVSFNLTARRVLLPGE